MRRAGIFALVLMLVTSMVAPSAMAAASASSPDSPDNCDNLINILGLEFSPTGEADECREQRQATELVQNVSWPDIYASGLAQADLRKSGSVAIANHLNDSKTYARTIVKSEAVKMFNNGSNKSAIKSSVNDSVESYYAVMQQNLLTTHNANLNQLWFAAQAETQADLTYAVVYLQNENRPYDYPSGADGTGKAFDVDAFDIALENRTVSLVDDSEMNISVIDQAGTLWVEPTGQVRSYDTYENIHFYTTDPSTNFSDHLTMARNNSVVAYEQETYRTTFSDINNTTADMKHQGAQFVDLLFQNYNQSEGVPISEVLNPNDLATQWNTNYETTGYYGWLSATLGLTGLEGNINSSFAINYNPRVDHFTNGNYSLNGTTIGDNGPVSTFNNTTGDTRDFAFVSGESYNISGTLMTDWDPTPNKSYAFQRGETYDTANTDVPVVFIEQLENDSRIIRLNGTFTISELTNVQTGESVNSTDLEEQNQQTWEENSSVTEIRNLVEYRNKSVNVVGSSDGSGGGGGGFNFGFDAGMAGIGAIAVLLGGAYLVSSGASKAS